MKERLQRKRAKPYENWRRLEIDQTLFYWDVEEFNVMEQQQQRNVDDVAWQQVELACDQEGFRVFRERPLRSIKASVNGSQSRLGLQRITSRVEDNSYEIKYACTSTFSSRVAGSNVCFTFQLRLSWWKRVLK